MTVLETVCLTVIFTMCAAMVAVALAGLWMAFRVFEVAIAALSAPMRARLPRRLTGREVRRFLAEVERAANQRDGGPSDAGWDR